MLAGKQTAAPNLPESFSATLHGDTETAERLRSRSHHTGAGHTQLGGLQWKNTDGKLLCNQNLSWVCGVAISKSDRDLKSDITRRSISTPQLSLQIPSAWDPLVRSGSEWLNMISEMAHNHLSTYTSALGDADISIICTGAAVQLKTHLLASPPFAQLWGSRAAPPLHALNAPHQIAQSEKMHSFKFPPVSGERLDLGFSTKYKAWWQRTHLWSQFCLS